MPHRKRILLSDDNEGFSTLLLESLHEHGGFHVLHAREEHEVMETIQCHKPHILLPVSYTHLTLPTKRIV